MTDDRIETMELDSDSGDDGSANRRESSRLHRSSNSTVSSSGQTQRSSVWQGISGILSKVFKRHDDSAEDFSINNDTIGDETDSKMPQRDETDSTKLPVEPLDDDLHDTNQAAAVEETVEQDEQDQEPFAEPQKRKPSTTTPKQKTKMPRPRISGQPGHYYLDLHETTRAAKRSEKRPRQPLRREEKDDFDTPKRKNARVDDKPAEAKVDAKPSANVDAGLSAEPSKEKKPAAMTQGSAKDMPAKPSSEEMPLADGAAPTDSAPESGASATVQTKATLQSSVKSTKPTVAKKQQIREISDYERYQVFAPPGPLGLKLIFDPDGRKGTFVKDIFPESPLAGQVRRGDNLRLVNSKQINRMKVDNVLAYIKSTRDKDTTGLSFVRLPAKEAAEVIGATRSKSSDSSEKRDATVPPETGKASATNVAQTHDIGIGGDTRGISAANSTNVSEKRTGKRSLPPDGNTDDSPKRKTARVDDNPVEPEMETMEDDVQKDGEEMKGEGKAPDEESSGTKVDTGLRAEPSEEANPAADTSMQISAENLPEKPSAQSEEMPLADKAPVAESGAATEQRKEVASLDSKAEPIVAKERQTSTSLEKKVKRFAVRAPGGKLGIRLEAYAGGKLGTHIIVGHVKPWSPLLEKLQGGDQLVAVDGKEISPMTSNDALDLIIKSIGENPGIELGFLREVDREGGEGSSVGSKSPNSLEKTDASDPPATGKTSKTSVAQADGISICGDTHGVAVKSSTMDDMPAEPEIEAGKDSVDKAEKETEVEEEAPGAKPSASTDDPGLFAESSREASPPPHSSMQVSAKSLPEKPSAQNEEMLPADKTPPFAPETGAGDTTQKKDLQNSDVSAKAAVVKKMRESTLRGKKRVERFTVLAPAGKLGLVLDHKEGEKDTHITVREALPGSPMAVDVRKRDQLVSVDGKEISSMKKTDVLDLIISTREKPATEFVFLREVDGKGGEGNSVRSRSPDGLEKKDASGPLETDKASKTSVAQTDDTSISRDTQGVATASSEDASEKRKEKQSLPPGGNENDSRESKSARVDDKPVEPEIDVIEGDLRGDGKERKVDVEAPDTKPSTLEVDAGPSTEPSKEASAGTDVDMQVSDKSLPEKPSGQNEEMALTDEAPAYAAESDAEAITQFKDLHNSDMSAEARAAKKRLTSTSREKKGVERFTVLAPAGALGLLLAADIKGEKGAIVEKILPGSVLAKDVRKGDWLLSVDGEEISHMKKTDVLNLIISTRDKGSTELVFVREVEWEGAEGNSVRSRSPSSSRSRDASGPRESGRASKTSVAQSQVIIIGDDTGGMAAASSALISEKRAKRSLPLDGSDDDSRERKTTRVDSKLTENSLERDGDVHRGRTKDRPLAKKGEAEVARDKSPSSKAGSEIASKSVKELGSVSRGDGPVLVENLTLPKIPCSENYDVPAEAVQPDVALEGGIGAAELEQDDVTVDRSADARASVKKHKDKACVAKGDVAAPAEQETKKTIADYADDGKPTEQQKGISLPSQGSLSPASVQVDSAERETKRYPGRRHAERFTVLAPAGTLGLVLEGDSNCENGTMVKKIMLESPLAGDVQQGDRLQSVDGRDITRMEATRILKLIASTRNRPGTMFTFVREIEEINEKVAGDETSVDPEDAKAAMGVEPAESHSVVEADSVPPVEQMNDATKKAAAAYLAQHQGEQISSWNVESESAGGDGPYTGHRRIEASARGHGFQSQVAQLNPESRHFKPIKKFVVLAPAGTLGLVLEADRKGPIVNRIKAGSVLAERVRNGDRLHSVDDREVSHMKASHILKLIASKKDMPVRKFVFSRECDDTEDSGVRSKEQATGRKEAGKNTAIAAMEINENVSVPADAEDPSVARAVDANEVALGQEPTKEPSAVEGEPVPRFENRKKRRENADSVPFAEHGDYQIKDHGDGRVSALKMESESAAGNETSENAARSQIAKKRKPKPLHAKYVKKFVVLAPAGTLGLVLEADRKGPIVNQIKSGSVLAERVRNGDRLHSVDDREVSHMKASHILKLIASKKDRPVRKFVFSREIKLDDIGKGDDLNSDTVSLEAGGRAGIGVPDEYTQGGRKRREEMAALDRADSSGAFPSDAFVGQERMPKRGSASRTRFTRDSDVRMGPSVPKPDASDPANVVDVTESDAGAVAPNDSVQQTRKNRKGPQLSEAALGTRSPEENRLKQVWELKTNQVMNATSLVINALHDGPWPSPVRQLDPARVAHRTDEEDTSHQRHLSMASASIQQFAQDVILPAMLAGDGDPRNNSRFFLGTLLMLREVMTQNARTVFGESALLTGREKDFLPGTEEDLKNGGFEEESGVFSAQVLATSVILTGLEGLEPSVAKVLSTEFLRMVEAYDGGEQEVANELGRVDEEVGVLLPNGAVMVEDERLAWQASYNRLRDCHPLIQRSRRRRIECIGSSQSIVELPRVPDPNAVHISILQDTSAQQPE